MTHPAALRLTGFTLTAYGACTDVSVPVGPGVTVVLGVNEAGKSTALAALSDLLWGIPRQSSQAFLHTRPYLRIDATVLDPVSGGRHLVRKASGLLEDDLVTAATSPWDPAGALSAEWWRTRLGLDLDQLRAGGEELFGGGGDLAEAVFAAREGRSARAVLDQLSAAGESLFKAHGGAKNVRLRLAFTSYQRAVTDRDAMITRSDEVTVARQTAARLTSEVESAQEAAADADRLARIAAEDLRVIGSVLDLARARDDLASLDAEGPRLSPEELDALDARRRDADGARDQLTVLDAKVGDLQASIDGLVVDEALLADGDTLGRLHPQAAARIADLSRADDEFGPAAARAAAALVALLADLGIATTVAEVDGAIVAAHVGALHEADLTAVADSLKQARDAAADAARRRDEALASLAARGVTIDPASGAGPRQDVMERLRSELVAARTNLVTTTGLLEQARSRLTSLRSAGPAPVAAATVVSHDVEQARDERNRTWQRLRAAWLSDTATPPDQRSELAEAVDESLVAADAVTDAEAAERARTTAHDAVLAAHVEGVEAARTAVAEAEDCVDGAARAVEAAERGWAQAWADDLGVADPPTTDAALELLSIISSAFQQQSLVTTATTRMAVLSDDWTQALTRAGLPADTTAAAWQARLSLLERIDEVDADRREALAGEAGCRQAWQGFADQAVELLVRHAELESGAAPAPADLERALTRLEARRGQAEVSRVRRDTLTEQLAETHQARAALTETIEAEDASRTRIALAYGTDAAGDVDTLADRASRAGDPLRRETAALAAITIGLDPGSHIDGVLDRLAGIDAVDAEQAHALALDAQREAQAEVSRLVELRTTARDRVRALESAGSAAEAAAEVEQQRAELIDLVERWSVITLQRLLLERALAGLGTDDTRPLLDRAGRILDRITAGRYVALRAEEDATRRSVTVLRADGTVLAPRELSEGTADQVYFALRLAGVAGLHEERMAAGLPALPCVLDDVLMAFDDHRTTEALEVLHELADGLQVIVFTHHQRVADAAAEIDGITVSVLPTPAAIEGALDGERVRAAAQQEAPREPAPRRSSQRADGDPDPATVRAWAIANGIEVSAKGRVPGPVLEQYRAAHT